MDTKERASLAGRARALKLSSDEKKAIGEKGALKRWNKTLESTHKGNFKESFGIDVDCYVLNDVFKTAVISQRGMGMALGLGDSGSRLTSFINGKMISQSLGKDLQEKLLKPLIFKVLAAGKQPPLTVHGFDVTVLIDLCKVIVNMEAENKLFANQVNIAKQAHIILNSSAKAGIKGLVYALSGYDPTRKEVIEAFKIFITEEAKEWAKEFPDELYEEWYRLYKISKPEKNRPWKFMHLTRDQIYRPLASSKGEIYDLILGKRGEDTHKRLHQFLSEIGSLALRRHIWKLLGIANISETQEQYEENLKRAFKESKDISLKST